MTTPIKTTKKAAKKVTVILTRDQHDKIENILATMLGEGDYAHGDFLDSCFLNRRQVDRLYNAFSAER